MLKNRLRKCGAARIEALALAVILVFSNAGLTLADEKDGYVLLAADNVFEESPEGKGSDEFDNESENQSTNQFEAEFYNEFDNESDDGQFSALDNPGEEYVEREGNVASVNEDPGRDGDHDSESGVAKDEDGKIDAEGLTDPEGGEDGDPTADADGVEAEGLTEDSEGGKAEGLSADPKGVEAEGLTSDPEGGETEGLTVDPAGVEAEGLTSDPAGGETEGLTEDLAGGEEKALTADPGDAKSEDPLGDFHDREEGETESLETVLGDGETNRLTSEPEDGDAPAGSLPDEAEREESDGKEEEPGEEQLTTVRDEDQSETLGGVYGSEDLDEIQSGDYLNEKPNEEKSDESQSEGQTEEQSGESQSKGLTEEQNGEPQSEGQTEQESSESQSEELNKEQGSEPQSEEGLTEEYSGESQSEELNEDQGGNQQGEKQDEAQGGDQQGKGQDEESISLFEEAEEPGHPGEGENGSGLPDKPEGTETESELPLTEEVFSAQTWNADNIIIYNIDGTEQSIKDSSEDEVVLIYGRTGCGNTRSSIEDAEKAKKKGRSIEIVLMDIDSSEEDLKAFAAEHENIVVAHHSDYNRQMWSFVEISGTVFLPVVVAYGRDGKELFNGDDGSSGKYIAFKTYLKGGSDAETTKVKFSGKAYTEDKEKILEKINEIRLEACEEGIMSPSSGVALQPSDYVPIKWSSALEKIAFQRAAEACVVEGNIRPNGAGPESVRVDGIRTEGEALYWNETGLMDAIEKWYDEISDYVENEERDIREYAMLIDPENHYVGVSSFSLGDGKRIATAAEFHKGSGLSEGKAVKAGDAKVTIETFKDSLSLGIDGKDYLEGNCNAYTYVARLRVEGMSKYGDDMISMADVVDGASWESSDKAVLSIDKGGRVSRGRAGSVIIKAKYNGMTAWFKVELDGLDMTDCIITLSDSEFVYDGTEKKPDVTVKCGTWLLEKGVDYDVDYIDNDIKGTAKADVYGIGENWGSVAKNFTISARDISNATLEVDDGEYFFSYTERSIPYLIIVKDGGLELSQNYDYSLEYTKDAEARTLYVNVTGMGNYTGTLQGSFVDMYSGDDFYTNQSLAAGEKFSMKPFWDKGNITYTSSDKKIATVSKKGIVSAKKVGIVTITATASSSGYRKATNTLSLKVTPAKTASLKLTNTEKGVKLNWKKVAGATGYYVYRNGKKLATVKKAGTVSYTDKKAKTNGKKYQYEVYAYAKTGRGAASGKTTIYYLTKPALSSAKNTSGKKIAVKWKKNAKASGYEIRYVTGKTKKTKTINKKATVSTSLTGLKKGKTYKVSIRSFKTVGETKCYSPWSAAKSVKILK